MNENGANERSETFAAKVKLISDRTIFLFIISSTEVEDAYYSRPRLTALPIEDNVCCWHLNRLNNN